MKITLEILKETFNLNERFSVESNSPIKLFLRELIAFKEKEDINHFIQQKMKLKFEFNFSTYARIPMDNNGQLEDFQKEEINYYLKELPLCMTYGQESSPKITYSLNGQKISYTISFEISEKNLSHFLKLGYFQFTSLSDFKKMRISVVKDNMKEHPLGMIHLSFKPLFHKMIEQVKTFVPVTSLRRKYGRIESHLYEDEKNLILGPGCIEDIANPTKGKDYYDIKINNFAPDSHIGFVKRIINQDKTVSFELISPGEIYKELNKNNQHIRFRALKNTADKKEERRVFFDKSILPLPILFSPKKDFKITAHNPRHILEDQTIDNKEPIRDITYHYNQLRRYNIYIGNEAQNKWIFNKINQLKENGKKVSHFDIYKKSLSQNVFITRQENVPLRYENDLSTPYHELNLKREASSQDRFIHISSINPLKETKPIALNKALPQYLQFKYENHVFCLIQYNVSKTVPKTNDIENAVPGYFSQNGKKLSPGKIYRNLSFDDLKQIKLHPEYGGSYYVLAACTKEYMKGVYWVKVNENLSVTRGGHRDEPPELWTIYTEGKDWNLLNTNRDKNNKIAYPYKINY